MSRGQADADALQACELGDEGALRCAATARRLSRVLRAVNGAAVSVYGHLHIPGTAIYDGVLFEEVSVGYPREWKSLDLRSPLARQVLPAPEAAGG